MKKLLSCLVTVLLLANANPARATVETFLKANVTGTVQTQVILDVMDGRVHTAVLNEKRIFQEFQVSKQDYELVFGTNSGLVLLPKHVASGLPTLTILKFGSSAVAIDTKARVFKLQADITPGTNTNLFKDLAGAIAGSAYYKGSFPPTAFSKLVLTAIARGTDTGSGGNGSALLKFKVTTGGVFVQQ